ncbi:MAG: hypothetical protein CMJ58_25645 [Planctomycetaceae bacterium]|nr:hypothetical protein [Planctomycetaceae bacterium]
MAAPIYDRLREHQAGDDVPWHELRAELTRLAAIFVRDFNLRVDEYAIGIARLAENRLGQYRPGTNALGLKAEIIISEQHIRRCVDAGEEWRVFGTLLHELDHAWQEVHGNPSKAPYHNVQFRMRAAEQGLLVDEQGCTQYDPGSPFFDVLEREGIPFPPIPEPKRYARKKGKSTLAKWICACDPPQIVRVGKAELAAKCLRCNSMFCCVDC